MSKSLGRVRRALEAAGVASDILEMGVETRTAAQAAEAAGCALDQIAKSIIFSGAGGGLHVFLTAGGNRVDPERAGAVAGEALGKADAAEVRARTGFVIGGVAPVGHLSPVRVWMDPRLFDFEVIWAAAGTPRHIFAISPQDLRRISQAQVTDFTGAAEEM